MEYSLNCFRCEVLQHDVPVKINTIYEIKTTEMRYSFLGDHNNLIFDAVFCRSRAYEIKRQKSTGKTLGEKNPRRSHFNAVSDSDRNVSRMKKLSRSARRIKSLRKKRIEKILFASQKEVYSFLLVTFLALCNIALTFCSFVKSLDGFW